MNSPIIAALKPTVVGVTHPRCGTCVYAQEFRADNTADCFGNPPSIVLLGTGRDPIGRPDAQLETFVPRVNRDRPACSLHKPKVDFATMGNS